MVKSSILIVLLLGVMFAQTIPAVPCGSDISGGDMNNGKVSKANETDEDIDDDESPALTCILFENLGCDTECSTIASAFSLKGTGKCTEENFCHCIIEQYDSLEGLFRSKFNAEDALQRIKKDKDLSDKVLKILQVPFQTIVQTERQLRKVVYPAIYNQLQIDDKTPAWELGLIGEIDNLYRDKIKEYVGEKLKPVLKSFSKQLTNVNYKSNLKKSLEGTANDDLQSIINEVRRTENKNLNDIVDNYLKSAKIKEEKNTEEDDLADAIGYQIIDQFVNHTEEKKQSVAKRPARKSSTKNAKKLAQKSSTKNPKKSKPANKKLMKQENPETRKKSSDTMKNNKKASNSSGDRFKLPVSSS